MDAIIGPTGGASGAAKRMCEGIKEGNIAKVTTNITTFDANVNEAMGQFELIPLVYAASQANENAAGMVEKLLELNADPNLGDQKGRFALLQAVQGSNLDMVKALIAGKANVHMTDPWRMSAIHYAAQERSMPVLQALMDAGAFTTEPGKYGRTPTETAIAAGHTLGSDILEALNTREKETKAERQQIYYTIGALGVLLLAAEVGTRAMSSLGYWCLCGPTWSELFLGPTVQPVQGRGAHGAATHELESLFNTDECDIGLAVGKILMCLCIGWMVTIACFWYTHRHVMKWKAF